MVRAGRLRDAIIIERPPTEKDSAGEQSGDWVAVASIWGNVQQMKGDEILTSQQVFGKVTTRVDIRFFDGLDTSHRINFEGRILSIVAVIDPDGFKRELNLFCLEQD